MKSHCTPALPVAATTQAAPDRAALSQEQSRRAAAAIDAYLQAGSAPAAGSRY